VDVQVSLALAFAAGFVSFLSACVLPVVPGCVCMVGALALDELAGPSSERAGRGAVLHSVLFMLGFGIVVVSLGFVPTALGPPIAHALPWLQRAGGVAIALYGLHLVGLFAWGRLAMGPGGASTARATGSLAAGVAFGAGWTPCIGPVLGSILLYVSRDETMGQGTVLLGTYALGLSVPFVATSLALNLPLAGSRRVLGRAILLRRLAGGVLVILGFMMVTGDFARVTAMLAGLGQLINLEL